MNPFSRDYIPQIKLKPIPIDRNLHATAEERRKQVLSYAKNSIKIPSQDESDESKRKAGRHLRG